MNNWSSILVISICILILLWFIYVKVRKYKADRKYKFVVSGGRSGSIRIDLDGSFINAEYEVGLGVDFIIYHSSLAFENGRYLLPEDILKLNNRLLNWSKERGSSFEIAYDT